MREGNAIIVLQARMGSRRLPGKAVERIGGRTILGRCLERLVSGHSGRVVLATTINREDDRLEDEARAHGVETVRGPVNDVLGRFVLVASVTGPRFIVRATADNPAVDVDAPGRLVEAIAASGADYVSEVGLPYGAAAEVMTSEALHRADRLATSPADREHVTACIKREGSDFASVELPAPHVVRRPDVRLTIDTAADLRFMTAVLTHAERRCAEASLAQIIDSADFVRRREAA